MMHTSPLSFCALWIACALPALLGLTGCGDSGGVPDEPEGDTAGNTTRVNAPPIVQASAPALVQRGASVTLHASGSVDPEGENLRFAWSQVSGPSVRLRSAQTDTATFETPDTPGTVVFRVDVSDGINTTSATVDVEIFNRAPTVSIEAPERVSRRATVTLQATGSDPDGDPIRFLWRVIEGNVQRITNRGAGVGQFIAPRDADRVVIGLVATDDVKSSPEVTVEIEISNNAPVANAGSSQDVFKRSWVVLDATRSTDPDGDAITYAWTQASGVPVVLNSEQIGNAGFESPSVSGPVVMSLIVSDGLLESAPGSVQINVLNRPPIADAGEDQTYHYRTTATLDAGQSVDLDTDPLQYFWEQVSGPSVELSDEFSPNPTFTTPEEDGVLVFRLTVFDGEEISFPDDTQVRVSYDYQGDRLTWDDHPFRRGTQTPSEALGVILDNQNVWIAQKWAGVASFPANPGELAPTGPIFELDRPGETLSVDASNGFVALARGFDGVDLLDVSDPSSAEVLSVLDTPGRARHVSFSEDDPNQLYIADHTGGFHIVDLSTPSNPVIVSTFPVEGSARFVLPVDSERVYVIDSPDRLILLNVSDPSSPRLEHALPLDDELLHISREGTTLWAAQARSIARYDITDPLQPTLLSTHAFSTTTFALTPLPNNLLAAAQGTSGVTIFDTSQPNTLLQRGAYYTPGSAHDLLFAEPDLAIANQQGGLHWVTPSALPGTTFNPTNLTLSASVTDNAPIGDVHAFALGTLGLSVVDASLSFEWARLPLASSALRSVAPLSQNLLLGATPNGLALFDLSDPTRPLLRDTLTFAGISNDIEHVRTIGTTAWIATRDNALHTINLTNPTTPVVVRSIQTQRAVTSLHVREDLIFAALEFSGVRIYSPSNLQSLAFLPIPGNDVTIRTQNNLLALASSTSDLLLYNISQPEQPTQQARIRSFGPLRDLVFQGSDALLYLDEFRGLSRLNIEDPTTPVLVQSSSFPDTPNTILLRENQTPALLSNQGNVLHTNPIEAPTLETSIQSPSLGEVYTWTLDDLAATTQARCIATGGVCTATPPTDEFPAWTVQWQAPEEPGDHEVALVLGHFNTVHIVRTWEVFVR